MPNGSPAIIPNVEAPTMIGGIADYFNYRHRGSLESSDLNYVPTQQNERDATVGDRCLVALINNSIMNAKIVAFYQHPNQTPEIPKFSEKPQAVFQLLGMRVELSPEGDVRFIRKGAPVVKYDPDNSALIDYNPLGKIQDAAAKLGGNAIKGNNNAQVEPAEETEVTLWEILKGGVFRLRDAEGQSFELNRDQGTILLSNDYYPSTLATDSVTASAITGKTAEYILFDKSAGSITLQTTSLTSINSLQDREETTGGNFSHEVVGSYTVNITGNETRSITGGLTVDVSQKYQLSSVGDMVISSKGVIDISEVTGGALKLSKGKVALGSSTAELLDLFDKTLSILSQLATDLSTEIHTGNLGLPTSPPLNAAQYVAAQVQLTQLQTLLGTIKGSL